jgi:hypothetical protein
MPGQAAQVTSIRRRWFLGPYWYRASRSQRVYDVTIKTKTADHRYAVVRVGGWILGSLAEKVDAEWP